MVIVRYDNMGRQEESTNNEEKKRKIKEEQGGLVAYIPLPV